MFFFVSDIEIANHVVALFDSTGNINQNIPLNVSTDIILPRDTSYIKAYIYHSNILTGGEVEFRISTGVNKRLEATEEQLKAVELNTLYTDLNSKLSGVKITKGNNLLNRNYVEPLNPFEYEKGGR